jgi:ABC-type glycerol-3-phosphate transport system substrate-binding protein
MRRKQTGSSSLTRRTFLNQLKGVGLVAAGGLPLLRPQISVAAPVTLSLWSGNGSIVPFYKMAAEEYAKTHPGFTLETQSTPIRELEQKLKASIPTDTGPDLFEIGRNITLAFADAGFSPRIRRL